MQRQGERSSHGWVGLSSPSPTGEPVGAEIDRVLRNRVLAGETGCGRGDATTMEGNWNWVGQPRVRLGWWAHGVE